MSYLEEQFRKQAFIVCIVIAVVIFGCIMYKLGGGEADIFTTISISFVIAFVIFFSTLAILKLVEIFYEPIMKMRDDPEIELIAFLRGQPNFPQGSFYVNLSLDRKLRELTIETKDNRWNRHIPFKLVPKGILGYIRWLMQKEEETRRKTIEVI